MDQQLIISIGREFGSGGHEIATQLAERFGLTLYDANLLEAVAAERKIHNGELEKYDEQPKKRLFSRRVGEYSSSMEEHIAQMQFDYLRKMADSGKSFVIVGRCAETVLRGYPALISIFVLGDDDQKIARVKRVYKLESDEEARRMMERENRVRKYYHNSYCKIKWGDSRNYDLSINSSRMGIDRTVDMLETYIKERMK